MAVTGHTKTRLYRVWRDMKNRCMNPNNAGYVNYGGRGITVYKDWLSFLPFREWAINNGYSDDLFIDREDNSLGYCPTNCRFVTRQVQQANRRSFKNSSSTYLGVHCTPNKTWTTRVRVNGIDKYLGTFKTELEAAEARDSFIKEHNLPLKLNLGA